MSDNTPGSHIADPGPLGLGAFALTTFVLSCVNSGLVDKSMEPIVFGLALIMGGGAQIIAGVWEFAKGNTFGATAFTSYGAFWISFWWLTGPGGNAKAIPAAHVGGAVGLYLLAWGIFTAYMTVAALKVNLAVLTVFVLLTATFFLLSFGNSQANTTLVHAAGWFGLATAAAAWYTSMAGVTKSTFGRAVFPTGA